MLSFLLCELYTLLTGALIYVISYITFDRSLKGQRGGKMSREQQRNYTCEDCETEGEIPSFGKCAICGGATSSFIWKVCHSCAKKKQICMGCLKSMSPIKEETAQRITQEVLKSWGKWVDTHESPDEPFIDGLSPRQILQQIKDGTELGMKIIENWIKGGEGK